jgi:Transposase family tnp2
VVGNATKKYSDFGNGAVHKFQHEQLGLFQDSRDIALALSTDGAQLTMKKQSNTWLLILIMLNLPPEIRYTTGNVIINLATPGPNSPGDIESFLHPLFEEMVQASEGLWIWDAVDSSYFTHRAYITMALGDMLGSAKLNRMAGHSAIFGDRFSHVQGAKASVSQGARALYYPMNPPANDKYNPSRPPSYNLTNLPMCQEEDY